MKNRLTLDYAQVAANVPVNRNAVSVTKNVGEHFDSDRKPNTGFYHWENCPVLIPIEQITHPNGRDLARRIVGKHKFGRFTIVGIYQEKTGTTLQQPAIWVARCTCGCYEGRTHRAMLNPENNNDMCRNCRHLEHIKRKYKELGPA